VQRLPSGDYLVDGRIQVDELNELLDIRIPDDEWDTLGGFLFGTLEHVPEPGESVDFDGWRFTVEEVEGRRIRLVRVSTIVAGSADADANGVRQDEPADRARG
jgi:CBS domain containing-hemolysin-like protein